MEDWGSSGTWSGSALRTKGRPNSNTIQKHVSVYHWTIAVQLSGDAVFSSEPALIPRPCLESL